MKKTLLFTLALFISTVAFSQSRSVVLRETFDSTSLPTGWTTTSNSTDNWTISQTNRAGGEANELKFNTNPKVSGASRIITNPVDLSGMTTITVSFRHFFDKKSVSGLIGIATSSNNGQTWNSAWTQTYSSAGQYDVITKIKTSDVGKNNVLFCLYFQGNSNNVNAWYFDDLEITSLETIDAKAQSIDMGETLPAGNNDIVFSIQNIGADTITSFEAKFNMNGETITETFETKLAQYKTAQFTFEKKIYLTPNVYDSEIVITSVNGQEDQNIVNNTLHKEIRVALNKTQRLPMIEHFSSSTCASCVPLDGTIKELLANNPNKYVYTKYVMNWPTYIDIDGDGRPDGDPYYTAEGGIRKNFYNVGSVPFLAYNGIGRSNKAIIQEEIDEIYNIPAFIDIKGSFNTEGQNISIVTDIMSYIDINNVKVHFSINEKITTGNTGSNGLKEFHHIMMKMFPDAQGSTANFKAGEYQRFEFSYDMSNTFVEEIEDLEVAVWIQDIDTKEILNSRYLYEYCEHPYPVQNLQLTNADNIQISWEAPEQGNPIGYNLYVNNELTLENTTELSYIVEDIEGFFGVEVVALYENDLRSIGVAKEYTFGESIIENNDIKCNIYPNPVNNKLYIETEVEIEDVVVYDIYGRQQKLSAVSSQLSVIDLSNLNAGIYIIKINTKEGNIVKQFIKN